MQNFPKKLLCIRDTRQIIIVNSESVIFGGEYIATGYRIIRPEYRHTVDQNYFYVLEGFQTQFGTNMFVEIDTDIDENELVNIKTNQDANLETVSQE